MTQQGVPPTVEPLELPVAPHEEKKASGWFGWILFAGVMMIIGGLMNAFYGLVAVVNSAWVGWADTRHVFTTVSTWGWTQLIVGLAVAFAGLGVLSGNIVARTVGVIVAALSLVANFMFIPVYPFWAFAIIVVDVLVIYALTVHAKVGHQL